MIFTSANSSDFLVVSGNILDDSLWIWTRFMFSIFCLFFKNF